MTPVLLKDRDHFHPDIDANYILHTSVERIYSTLHTHEFFEFFVLVDGSILHLINGRQETVEAGTLVFMRPKDTHAFARNGRAECQLANLAFPQSTLDALLTYIGQGTAWHTLIRQPMPPHVRLTPMETDSLVSKLEALNHIAPSRRFEIRVRMRALLIDVFTQHFLIAVDAVDADQPAWLRQVRDEMRKPENFVAGYPKLLTLANRSAAHVARTFQTFCAQSPVEYVNELRLNYAANLLVHTDLSVIDVALDSGFENLSHFYHWFRQQFGTAPASYRRANHIDFT